MTAFGRVVGWFVPVGPPERLAVLRVLVAGFVAIYLAVRAPAFLALAENPATRFEPIGVLSGLEVLGFDRPLPELAVYGLLLSALVFSALTSLGLWHRVSGPLFGVTVLVLLTYRSSWGQILWFEILIALQALIVGFSPAADALAVRSSTARRRDPSISYGWPVRLAAIVTIMTYVLAGIAKIRYGGSEWFTDGSMRNHIAFSAARLEVLGAASSPVAAPVLSLPGLGGLVSWGVVLIELLAPVAFLGSRLRWAWISVAWLMHALIAATMFVVFPVPLFGLAFAPLLRLEKLVG